MIQVNLISRFLLLTLSLFFLLFLCFFLYTKNQKIHFVIYDLLRDININIVKEKGKGG